MSDFSNRVKFMKPEFNKFTTGIPSLRNPLKVDRMMEDLAKRGYISKPRMLFDNALPDYSSLKNKFQDIRISKSVFQ
jgi:hypothetical protein